MFPFFCILIVWWFIHFAHYYAGKSLLKGLSESQLVELVSYPPISKHRYRRSSTGEKVEQWIGVILFFILGFAYRYLFFVLKIALFPQKGLVFNNEEWLFLPAFLMAVGTVFLLFIFLIKKGKNTPAEDWILQPSKRQAEKIVTNWKLQGTIISLCIQLLLLFSFFQYTNIQNTEDEEIEPKASIFSGDVNTIQTSDIQLVKISISTVRTSRGGGASLEELVKHFEVKFHDGQSLELWNNDLGLSNDKMKKLKTAVAYFKENNVEIEVAYPHFLDWSKYREILSMAQYKALEAFFEYCRDVADGIDKPIALGQDITMDSIRFKVNSTSIGYGSGFFKATAGHHFLYVNLTVFNGQHDTTYFNRLDVRLVEENDSTYRPSMFAENTFESEIPPNTTHSGKLGFLVPNKVGKLQLKYQLGFMDTRLIWFELE